MNFLHHAHPDFVHTTSMEMFVGKFQRISTEKQTELLQALGLSSMCIRLASLAPHPVLEISLEQDGEVVIRTTSGLRSHVKRFRLGQPFEAGIQN